MPCTLNFSLLKPWCDCANHTCRHLILKIENVIEPAVEMVCPDMSG